MVLVSAAYLNLGQFVLYILATHITQRHLCIHKKTSTRKEVIPKYYKLLSFYTNYRYRYVVQVLIFMINMQGMLHRGGYFMEGADNVSKLFLPYSIFQRFQNWKSDIGISHSEYKKCFVPYNWCKLYLILMYFCFNRVSICHKEI